MTSFATSSTAVDPLAKPVQWIGGMIIFAASLAAAVLALGGTLYYTLPVLATVFTFVDPVGGYWKCTLLVLGAYAAVLVIDAARNQTTVNFLAAETRAQALDLVGKLLVLFLVALVISEVLA